MVMFIYFSTTLSSLKCCNYEMVCCLLDGEGHGNLQTYCPQFCSYQTHCRSHCLHFWNPAEHLCLVIPAISEHWADSSVAGWLLIFGMDFQLMRFYRQKLLPGALHWKTCGVAYALDSYSHIVAMCMRFITVKKPFHMHYATTFKILQVCNDVCITN